MAANHYTYSARERIWESFFHRSHTLPIFRVGENPAVIDGIIYPESDTEQDGSSGVTGDEEEFRRNASQMDDGSANDSTRSQDVEEYGARDIMSLIMEPGGGLTNQLQCKTISDFCHSARLCQLQNDSPETLGNGRILLDDKSLSSKEARPYLGPLNAHQLYEELKRKRFFLHGGPPHDATATEAANGTSGSNVEWDGILGADQLPGTVKQPKIISKWKTAAECDAERRLIFFENPDERDILVLLATASQSHAPVLRDFVHNYLAFKTSIGLRASPHGPRCFYLFFHLPYFAFREGAEPIYDKRQWENGQPLRRTLKLPALEIATNGENTISAPLGCLYETQVSVGTLVLDDRPDISQTLSITYGFVDMYHGSPESVKLYDDWVQPGFRPDPFTYGERDADIPILCPREYFLYVLEVRIRQVFIEWGSVVSVLKRTVKEKGPTILVKTPSVSRVSQMSQEDKRRQQYSYTSWINEMMELLSDLMGLLSTTIDAWEEFEKRNIDLFPGRVFTPVINIEGTFSEMRLLHLELGELKEKLVENRDALIAHLSVENNDVAKFVKILTIMTILFMPISLSTALFSTQNGVMPFDLNFPTFLISFAILGALVVTAWFVLSYWEVARHISQLLADGRLLAHKDNKRRFNNWMGNVKTETTTNSEDKESLGGENQRGSTFRPSGLQRVLVGIPLGMTGKGTSRKRSLRALSKQRLSSFLSRGKKDVSAPDSVSGDIERGP